jgi:hypothetical protein
MTDKERLDQLESWIRDMAQEYQERRTDVSDNLDYMLDGTYEQNKYTEHRIVQARCGNTWVEYDTLTTLMRYMPPNKKHYLEAEKHDYYD